MTDPRNITIAGSHIDHYHIAAIVSSRDEEYEVLRDYMKDGLDRGEKTIHICDPAKVDDHRTRLGKLGVKTSDCERSGQLEVLSWHDAHLRGGRFDKDDMLSLLEEVTGTCASQGFDKLRFIGHMDWADDDYPGVERLMEYESVVTDVLNRLQQPAICVYDVSRLSAATIMDALRVHPYVVVDGKLHESQFYVPIDEFVKSRATA